MTTEKKHITARINADLHALLVDNAKKEGFKSFNKYVEHLLTVSTESAEERLDRVKQQEESRRLLKIALESVIY